MADYTTSYLLGMLAALDRPNRVLLDLFFRDEVVFDTEEIVFDKIARARRLAPFVSPYVAGKAMRLRGAEVTTFKPAYVKPKNIITPGELLKRRPGEALSGALSPEERRDMVIQQTLSDQDDQISRREEWMAAQALTTGSIVVAGDAYPQQLIDYGRAAGHTVTLTSTDRWGETGVSPLANLRTWGATVASDSGFNPRQVIMDPLAAELCIKDADLRAILNIWRQASGKIELAGAVSGALGEEIAYLGNIGNFDLWQYQQIYTDAAGNSQKMIPDYTVIMGSPLGMEGVRAYGAILDHKALRPLPRFPKMWEVEDPSIETLMTQSAPLPIMRRPDATLSATVR